MIGCTQTDEFSSESEDSNAMQLYQMMSKIPTTSILADVSSESRSSSEYEFYIPTFSQNDLNYLASLNQDEFEAFRNELIERLGPDGIDKLEEIQDINYDRICDILGGHEGMNKLEEFSLAYIETPGGWSYVQELLPINLTDKQINTYISFAVYIDKVSRPLYKTLTSDIPHSRVKSMCELNAAISLVTAGINIGVDVMVDIMTGGAGASLTPLEEAAMGAELTSIWIDYEICNGRWH